MTQEEKEKNLLAGLDLLEYEAWKTVVTWFASKLSQDDPKMLAEIIIRRGMMRAEAMTFMDADGKAEQIAFAFGDVGVKLTV